jgi:hypothetical protein
MSLPDARKNRYDEGRDVLACLNRARRSRSRRDGSIRAEFRPLQSFDSDSQPSSASGRKLAKNPASCCSTGRSCASRSRVLRASFLGDGRLDAQKWHTYFRTGR